MQIYENNLICRQADRNSAFIRPKLRLCRDPSQPKNLTKWQIFNISKKFKKAKKRPKMPFCNRLIVNTNFLSKFTQIPTLFLPYFTPVGFDKGYDKMSVGFGAGRVGRTGFEWKKISPRCIILPPLHDIYTKAPNLTEKEYKTTVNRLADEIYRFALCCCRDASLADDAVQEAYTALWERRRAVESIDDARRFLLVVAKRKLSDHWRHGQKEQLDVNDLDTQSEVKTEPFRQMELRDTLDKAMATLSEKQRTIVALHDIEGYDYEEIAAMTGETYTAVQVTAFRARVKLRQVLTKYGY